MQSLGLRASAAQNEPLDLTYEIVRLNALVIERQGELAALQESLRQFKARYTQAVGGPLAELAEVERLIKAAEARVLGAVTPADEEAAESSHSAAAMSEREARVRTPLRKLFWEVAKMFHPDHAADEKEAERRHMIMAEANRAYREGDTESLHTLLGDDDLQFLCTSAHTCNEEEDLASRLLNLKEELRTIEFGIKRTKQDGLYKLQISIEEAAAEGRDALHMMAERINRQIAKAKRRLEHLT